MKKNTTLYQILGITGGEIYLRFKAGATVPTLKRPKLSKKHKRRRMKFKKLYEDNSYWNDWKFQLHWHKIE